MSSNGIVTLKRILSAVIALPIYVFFIMTDSINSLPVFFASTIVSLACLYEFYQIVKSEDKGSPFIISGLIFGLFINILMYVYAFGKIYGYNKYLGEYDVRTLVAIISLFLVIIMFIQVIKRPIEGGIYSLSTTVFGLIYIVISFSHIILLKALPGGNGIYYILLLHLVVMINDSAAYFGGVFFGNHKTGLAISPNKTWEGYFSGMLFSIISIIVFNEIMITFYSIKLFSTLEAAFLGVILSLFGNMGDLIESSIKRDGRIKDSGSIIPGHGGMWDVFDALIFCLPVFYYYLKIKSVIG